MKRLGRILLFSVLGLLAAVVLAVAGGYGFLQTSAGKTWLAAMIGRTLSEPGLTVTLDGLSGTPPFDIRVAAIHGADRKGTWLEIQQAVLTIDGAALLRREVVIETLRFSAMQVTRAPIAEPTTSSTSLDLSPPKLPVAVSVQDVGIDTITLDPAVLGEPVRLSFQGHGGLAKGRAAAHLDLRRTDDRPGQAALDLTLEGQPPILDLKGEIDDPRGILAAELMQRTDRPPMSVTFAGRAPISDWRGQLDAKLGTLLSLHGDVGIASGATYKVTITAEARQDGLLPPAEAALIGDRLGLAATLDYDGKEALKIESLHLTAAIGEISAQGAADSATQRLDGRLRVSLPDLRPLQPVVGESLAGRLDVDATVSGTLTEPKATIHLQGDALRASDMALDQLTAQIALALAENGRQWKVKAEGKLAGLTRPGAPLPDAIGHDFDWSVAGSYEEAGPLVVIDAVRLEGGTAKLAGQGRWAPQEAGGKFGLDIAELARFAGLAQLPALAGRAHVEATLSTGKGGATRVELQGSAEQLHTGVALADALLGPDISIAGDLDRSAAGKLTASNVHLAGTGIKVTGEGESDETFERPTGSLHVELPRLADLGPPLNMKLQGRATLEGKLVADDKGTGLQVDLAGDALGTDRLLAQRLTTQLRIANFDINSLDHLAGDVTATASLAGPAKGIDTRLEASFAQPAPDKIELPRFSLTAGGTRVTGKVAYSLTTGLADGNLQASIADLAPWSALAGTPLKGSANATVALAGRQGQSADIKLDGNALSVGKAQERIAIRRLVLTAKVWNLLKSPLGQADLALTDVAEGDLQLAHVGAKLNHPNAESITFTADAKGNYNLPDPRPDLALALDLSGSLQMKGRIQEVGLDRLTVKLGQDSAKLERRLLVSIGPGTTRVQDLALNFAGGTIAGSGALEGNRLHAQLTVRALPLRPLGRLAGQRLVGTLDATANLDGPASAVAGNISLKGRGLKFSGLGQTVKQLPPLDLDVALTPGGGRAGIQGQVSVQGSSLIGATGSIPLVLSARPFAVSVPQSGELRLDLAGAGKLEKLAQILPIGEDRVAGNYSVNLDINGTPARPATNGKVIIANGSYLNQDFGTELRGLALELTGNQSRLELTRLSAQDSKTGQLQGSGSLDFAGTAPHLDIQAKMTNFLIANSDNAQAPVDAELRASGAMVSPSLYGRITLRRSEFRIPDSLPPSIANLNVIEIDSRDPQRTARVLAAAEKRESAPPAVPMALDVQVTAPGQIFVRGHGLDSEWRGNIKVTGSTAAQTIGGGLNVVRGTFSLLGKDFVIQRGTIRFPTGSFEDAWIDLLAEYNASDIVAQVHLTGSPTAPHLELTSTPQLPRDQILSRVLFGSDAGRLTASQGLELALAARAMAEGGPGLLDKLRGDLGLDRLGFGSASSTGNSGNAAASGPTINAGKYVAPGVYVGVEQGASTQSSRAKVEVDLMPHVTGYSSVGADSSNRVGVDWRMDY